MATFSKYLYRKCPIHIATLTARVYWVHVCGPLAVLSRLTYIFATHSPTIPTLFFTVRPDPVGPSISPFWARHHTFFRESRLTVYHGSDFHAYCCTTGWLWQRPWPSSKQCFCQTPQFLYVKNNMRVLHFTKVSEWLISQLLPWLKVRVLVS